MVAVCHGAAAPGPGVIMAQASMHASGPAKAIPCRHDPAEVVLVALSTRQHMKRHMSRHKLDSHLTQLPDPGETPPFVCQAIGHRTCSRVESACSHTTLTREFATVWFHCPGAEHTKDGCQKTHQQMVSWQSWPA